MEVAKERSSSEKYVWAQDAFPSRYYVCPSCSADVFLRRGRWRSAHFAHRAGTGKPECENFHASNGLTYTWNYGTTSEPKTSFRPSEPLLLGIELQPESMVRGRRSRAWELRVTVPKSEDEHGQIRLDCGAGVKRLIPLLKLTLGSQTYPVDADTEDFGAIWCSPEVKAEYREVVEDRVRGLDRELATVFSSSQQTIKPRVDRLTWGGSYYLVWHDTYDLGQPRKIIAQPLSKHGSWNCSLITLPDEEDAEIKAWLESASAVSLTFQRRLFGIIYPPPLGYDILGRLTVPMSASFLVGFRQPEEESERAGALRLTAGSSCVQIALEGAARHLVCVGIETIRTHLSFAINDAALPPLSPIPIAPDSVFAAAEFKALDNSTGKVSHHNFGGQSGRLILNAVREQKAVLTEFRIPSGIRGHIRWKREKELAWSTRALGHDGEAAHVVLTSDNLDQINHVLSDKSFEVEIELGAFGRFVAPREQQSRAPLRATISVKTRARINWLLNVAAIYADERGVPTASLSDADALALVKSLRPVSHLLSHQRSIIGAVARGLA